MDPIEIETNEDKNMKSDLFIEAVLEASGYPKDANPRPNYQFMSHNFTWESLEISGFPKPSKDAVESLYAEKLKSIPLLKLRAIRDRLLADSDKYAASDFPHASIEKANEWKEYRQKLRDMPETEDPENPTWPRVPEK